MGLFIETFRPKVEVLESGTKPNTQTDKIENNLGAIKATDSSSLGLDLWISEESILGWMCGR